MVEKIGRKHQRVSGGSGIKRGVNKNMAATP
jgi:hypothetical protein